MPCRTCCQVRGGLLLHRFTIAGSACPVEAAALSHRSSSTRLCCLSAASQGTQDVGRLFSVPLSIASRRPAVRRHPALWSPDFPLHGRKHHAATAQPASRVHPILAGESPGADISSWSPNFWLRRNLKVSLRRNQLQRIVCTLPETPRSGWPATFRAYR